MLGLSRKSRPRSHFSVSLAPPKEIQTRRNFRAHKWLSKLSFLNYTKMTKYEALEKNAVSNRKMRLLTNLRYGQSQVNGSVFWGVSGTEGPSFPPDDRSFGGESVRPTIGFRCSSPS